MRGDARLRIMLHMGQGWRSSHGLSCPRYEQPPVHLAALAAVFLRVSQGICVHALCSSHLQAAISTAWVSRTDLTTQKCLPCDLCRSFKNNPWVLNPPGFRFYAASPLVSTDGGHRYGTL